MAGYEDINVTELLCDDPALRHVVCGITTEKAAASTRHVRRFETDVLTCPENLTELMNLSGRWIYQVCRRSPTKQVVLDMESSVSPTYGHQEGTTYNGHFECTCYHPLFCFNLFGDLQRALLREGQVHGADDWWSVLETVMKRYRDTRKWFFRGDVAFANPELYEFLEAEGYRYAIGFPANDVLYKEIAYILTHHFGRHRTS